MSQFPMPLSDLLRLQEEARSTPKQATQPAVTPDTPAHPLDVSSKTNDPDKTTAIVGEPSKPDPKPDPFYTISLYDIINAVIALVSAAAAIAAAVIAHRALQHEKNRDSIKFKVTSAISDEHLSTSQSVVKYRLLTITVISTGPTAEFQFVGLGNKSGQRVDTSGPAMPCTIEQNRSQTFTVEDFPFDGYEHSQMVGAMEHIVVVASGEEPRTFVDSVLTNFIKGAHDRYTHDALNFGRSGSRMSQHYEQQRRQQELRIQDEEDDGRIVF